MNSLPSIKCLVLHSEDNVGILMMPGEEGQSIDIDGIKLKKAVPGYHKIAIKLINSGQPVIKYGQIIGISNQDILPGEHVHVHNIKFLSGIDFTDFSHKFSPENYMSDDLPSYFNGFLRRDGRAGIRNYLIVASAVNCSATVTKEVALYFRHRDLSKYGIDGVIPITHLSGCAMAPDGYGTDILYKTITGWLNHPNVVGGIIIGLGCEVVTVGNLIELLLKRKNFEKDFFEYFNIQEAGGTRKSITKGIQKIETILERLPLFERVKLPVSLLTVALNCGGSDALSGVTANPALGIAGDILVSYGGTIVLAEVPECYGGKELLVKRCISKKEGDKLEYIFSWWNDYTKKHNVSMNDNISPGNIAGGISTILEKSLGAISKGGSSPVTHVMDYAEPVTGKGLCFMNTPGFDPVSVTGLVAGGANLVAFTTGRGSVYGCSIAPTVKIATNSELYEKCREDIDINAGVILDQSTPYEVGRDIYRFLIDIANDKKTCSEILGIGTEEFAPWQIGEIL